MRRLSKLIAEAGVASRRKAADLIRAGRVRVNGATVTDPAVEVAGEGACVEVDGQAVQREPKRYFLLNKPVGVVSTAVDDRGRRTVLDVLGEAETRLYPAGRLDADTEGLLLITNDGDLTHRLTHPRHGMKKVYQARVAGRPSSSSLERLEGGVMLEEGHTGPVALRVLKAGKKDTLLEITVGAGRKRMIRRMLQQIGHPVLELRRTQFGPLVLGGLAPGQWRSLTAEEVSRLKAYTTEKAAPETGTARPRTRRRQR